MTVAPEIADNLTEASRLFDMDPKEGHVLNLAERFLLPPFTVLDARGGEWKKRKEVWLGMGLRSEDGRDARMLAKSVRDEIAIDPETGEEYLVGAPPGSVNAKILAVSNGQSIFDPVLCELAYRWFCPTGGRVLDPYAGGSVRGLVAGWLGLDYTGIDLSDRQVDANEAQADEWLERGFLTPDDVPVWVRGDSWRALYEEPYGYPVGDGPYDFIWSCPPYHDLEVYSDHPDDHSNMAWDEFKKRYSETIEGAVERLADDRFAGFVVGEIREQPGPGYYRNFVGLTIDAFERAGAAYYNELILVTPAGTLPLRTAKQFLVSRKMGRTHQTVLLFVKGDPRKAADACLDKKAMEAAMRAAGRDGDLEAVLDADDVTGADDLTTTAH